MQIKSVSYKEKERILSHALFKAKPLAMKDSFSGPAPAPFVGHFGYPHVNLGLLAPPTPEDDVWKYDDPNFWSSSNKQISDVVNYRVGLVNSKTKVGVKSSEKIVSIAQEVALASKPAEIEASFEKPRLNLSTNQWTAPMGPQAKLKKLDLTSNTKIPTKIQKCFYDTDLLAADALKVLYKKNVDENSLMRMLSVGSFGKEKNRKLVPTRWSITATDDIISKDSLETVRDLPTGNCRAYFGDYLGNYYLVLLLPERWSYELFELYVSQPNAWKNGEVETSSGVLEYSTDYEEFQGRKNYAEACAGGYYTVRLALADHMKKVKRQNSALVIRFITNEYVIPLGVWVTREATRKALANKPIEFASKELLFTYAKHLAKKKFGLDISPILKQSKLLKERQTPLSVF